MKILFLCIFAFALLEIEAVRLNADDIPVFVPDRIEETDFWAIEVAPGTDPEKIASKHGQWFIGSVGPLKNIYLFLKKPDTEFGKTHPHHNESSEIVWFDRQLSRQRHKRAGFSFSDPLYSQQWHLHPTNIAHVDVNVVSVWQQNITGGGVVVSIVDDGLEYTHDDIAPNYVASASYDFNFDDPNPFPDFSNDDHGTSAGGVAAARDNGVCGVGTAPRAGISGIRLISKGSTDAQEASALTYQYNQNDIYSSSWGPQDDGRRKEGPGRLASLALQTGVTQGRNGKGSIYAWAGGNGRRSGDNCNYDGWANSRYTIAVGAVDYSGVQAWYSESCAMLVVAAPSSGNAPAYSVTTTDLKGGRGTSSTDCTSSFGGTSAAAPMVAGIIALVLQANPNLGWRDVQGVLINSASMTDNNDADWTRNGAGLHINHKYGFGLVNAAAAVQAAKSWENYGPSLSVSQKLVDDRNIPEGDWIQMEIKIDGSIIVEHVDLLFQASHRRRGDLRIVLVSPQGTSSTLAEPHNDVGADYNWTFGTIRAWGENSQGTWILKVKDEVSGNTGKMIAATLTIYGR